MSGAAVLPFSGGSRAFVRALDSASRQSLAFDELLLAAPTPAPGLVESAAARLHAVTIAADGIRASANEAVRRATSDYVAIIAPGFRLRRDFHERCAAVLDAHPAVAAVAPAVRVYSPDGRWSQCWQPDAASGAIGHPRGTPPVLFIRRSAWIDAGGLDESLPLLADYDLWIRLALRGACIEVLPEQLVLTDVTDEGWPGTLDDPRYLDVYLTILERHRSALEAHMAVALIDREIGFGTLRNRHTALLSRRDADLAELDRLRAETAHRQAFIAHHGRDEVDWGDLRRLDPISRDWGYDRGTPIDRHYIEAFLAAHSSDIRGAVLEVQEDDFTRRFGGTRVASSAVLDLDDCNAAATVIADLRCARELPPEQYDCIILTQTVHVIDDMPAVFRECHRLLRPGGVLLATLPCASRVCLEYGDGGDLWRVTPAGARVLAETAFPPGAIACTTYGNVLTNVAFLHGLSCAELTEEEFNATDPYHPAVVGVRAQKPAARRTPGRSRAGVVLLYHRIEDAEDDVHGLSMPRAVFEQQVDWMRRECGVLPLDEMLVAARDGLPERAVAITFDDGYVDNVKVAAPVLASAGLPATFFVTSRWLQEPGEYWWDLLERTLFGTRDLPSFLSLNHDGRPLTLSTATPDERRAAHSTLHDRFVHANLPSRDALAAQLTAWGGAGPAVRRPMRADEVRALAAVPGMRIGAHTVNHLALPDQPAEVQHRELEECRAALERVLGTHVRLFAYPYGAWDRAVAARVRDEWRWSMTCEARAAGCSFDAALVPRVEVKNGGSAALAQRLAEVWR